MGDEAAQQVCGVTPLDQVRRRLQGIEPRVADRSGHLAYVLDVDTVNLVDLVDHEVEQVSLRQFDDKLVYGPPSPPFENVDADQVSSDCADPARDGTEGPRPVWDPDTHEEGCHALTLREKHEHDVSSGAPQD
jgi:hypothetical protein